MLSGEAANTNLKVSGWTWLLEWNKCSKINVNLLVELAGRTGANTLAEKSSNIVMSMWFCTNVSKPLARSS